MNIVESLQQRFQRAGIDNAKRVAEELLAHVLGGKPLDIYLRDKPPSADQLRSVDALAMRIESGEPMPYVIGQVDFRGLLIRCDPRALIPRPETEWLVEEVLRAGIWTEAGRDRGSNGHSEVRANRRNAVAVDGQPAGSPRHPPMVIDVGTGTGCIALALAQDRPEARLIAVDSSSAALELARENALLLRLDDRVEWKENHLLDGFAPGSCDAVVANLPYIATSDWQELAPAVRSHEPRSALDSGPTGLERIEELAGQARRTLVPGGRLFLEIGYDQGSAVIHCLDRNGYRDIRIRQDLAGLDRIVTAVNPPH